MSGNQIGKFSGKPTGGNPGFSSGIRNGRIPLALLGRCETQSHAAHPLLYKPAATAFDALTRAAKADGVIIEAVALYRDYAGQVKAKADWTARGKPNNAARPGTSSHGWGTAADVNRYLPGVLDWLKRNAVRFGWDSPLWAMDGKGTEEPWHWQYILGAVVGGAEPEIPVYVNGTLVPNADAYREEGIVMVASVAVAKTLGWHKGEAKDGMLQLLFDGAQTSVPFVNHGGIGYSPVRELGTRLGVACEWDAAAGAVRIG